MKIDKRQRVECALNGSNADRLPYSFWTHYPGIDLEPELIATETAKLVHDLDLDFVKTMPNGLYCVEDWGIRADYSEIAGGGVAKVLDYAVKEVADWASIRRLDVSNGAYGRELRHLRRVLDLVGPNVPVLATAFSPLTIASKLAGSGYRAHFETGPVPLKAALGEIAATVSDFCEQAIALGCAGVFLASQESTTQAMTAGQYAEFGVPFDHHVLAGAAGGWFNAIHMHGEDILFDLLQDYPVHALNWHIGETSPTLDEYRAAGGTKPVVGGIRRMGLTQGNYELAVSDIDAAIASMGGTNLLLTPGCVIRYPVDTAFLKRVSDHIKSTASG